MNLHEIKPAMPWGLYPDEWTDDMDWIELHGVKDFGEDPEDGTMCEMYDEGPPDFWSLYGHLREGGVMVIGDFTSHGEAVDAAVTLATEKNVGWDDYSYN